GSVKWSESSWGTRSRNCTILVWRNMNNSSSRLANCTKDYGRKRSSSVCVRKMGVKRSHEARHYQPDHDFTYRLITSVFENISLKFTTVVCRRQLASIGYASLSNLVIIALNQLDKTRGGWPRFSPAEGIVDHRPATMRVLSRSAGNFHRQEG